MTTDQIIIELHTIARDPNCRQALRDICGDAATRMDKLMGWNNASRQERIIRDYKIGAITRHDAVGQLGRLGFSEEEIAQMDF